MSNLSDFKLIAPSQYDFVKIGETITVLTKNPPPSTYFNGDYLLTGTTYLQSQYPELFAKLGIITAPGVGYNTSTHFYVPVFNRGYPTVSSPGYRFTQPQLTTYMRAR